MTLPTNDEFSNRELSIEELEAIAAGWPSWVHAAVHFVEHEASVAVHYALPVVTAIVNYFATHPPGPTYGRAK
jgi:hypothetical protein